MLSLLFVTALLAPRTAAIVIGHPDAPDKVRLETVRSDVVHMAWFFKLLGAEHVYIHHRSAQRRATLDAIDRTVRELRSWASEGGAAQIYVYYAGHGERLERSEAPTTRIFLEHPESLDGRGLADRILRPLGEVADVHFIADACQSFNLLSVRGGKRRRTAKMIEASDDVIMRRFFDALPRVGAALATNGTQNAYEDPESGGRFSAALRSVVLGWGDINGDSTITYRELALAIRKALEWHAGRGPQDLDPPDPRILGPEDRLDAPFASFAGRADIARVVVDADRGRRRKLRFHVQSFDRPIAVVNLPPGAEAVIHLAKGQTYTVEDADTREQWAFVAQSAPWRTLTRPASAGWLARGVARSIADVPFDPRTLARLERPVVPPTVQPLAAYLSFGLQTGQRWHPSELLGAARLTTVAFQLRGGQARHQWLVDFETSLAVDAADGAGADRLDYTLQTHRLRAGYLGLLGLRPIEVGVGARLGGGILDQAIPRAEQTNTSYLMTATAHAEAVWPIPGFEYVGLLLEAGAGAQALCARGCSAAGLDLSPELSARLGIDIEVTAP